eukprot:g9724.t1
MEGLVRKHSGKTNDAGVTGSDTAGHGGSGGKRRSRAPSPSPVESSSGSRDTNKPARRGAGGEDLYPVRVKRQPVDNSSVPDDERAGDCPETDAVVKAEDMEVPCKAEPTKATGLTIVTGAERRKTARGQTRGS